ncbi:MAG: redox-regulated ATPase YchF [Bacillota bacterium]
MKIGLVGLPGTGKTTLFQMLTGNFSGGSSKGDAASGVMFVPDERVRWLAGLFKPRKTTFAQIELVDIPGLIPGRQAEGGPKFLQEIRKTDALAQVLRVYEGPIPHPLESINPVRDVDILQAELLCADLDLVEKRLSRLAGQKKSGPDQEAEHALLKRLEQQLEEKNSLSNFAVNSAEEALLKNYDFFTLKPVLLAVNMDEVQWKNAAYPGKDELKKYAGSRQIPLVDLSVRLEKEIMELPEAEWQEFLKDAGIDSSGLYRLARAIYSLLGFISFFTVGEDEVKAWTIKRGTPARKAAGKIHTDIEKGFIRAEVVSYDHMRESGSVAGAREKGRYRLEGKEYVVEDGDIINFRFNI